MKPPRLLLPLWFSCGLACAAAGTFSIEKMPNPAGVDPQIGGVATLPDGRVVAVFHRGEVMIFDPAGKSWAPFASGLQEPLGVLVESPSSFLVMQRAELTRLTDTDGDGLADDYATVFDGFGMSGNYHEFAFGPVKGPDGMLYLTLNLASNGAGVRAEVRGPWSKIGALDHPAMTHDATWQQRAEKAGRMYSRVPWRGWVLRLTPDGKTVEPFACGFRSPDGFGFDAAGDLLVTDNEGDWRGTSPLYIVKKGGFYGHPASLIWREDWDGRDPLQVPLAELQTLRTREAARFPQGDLANSPTQVVVFPASWGPYAGQTLIGEMNQNRMVRFLPDDVAGFRQGALIPMFDGTGLGNGNHRLAFGPDGALWVGKTHLSWAGAEGLVKISPEGARDAFIVTGIHLTADAGHSVFRIRFNRPAAKPEQTPALERYDFLYRRDYGSPKIGQGPVAVTSSRMSADGLELDLACEVVEGPVHRIDLSALRSATGQALEGDVLYYQATRIPAGPGSETSPPKE